VIYTSKYKLLKKEHQHLAATKLLSIGLKIEENIDYFNEPIIVNDFGKPRLKNYPAIYYNISHCKDYIALIISRKYQVGIDVEEIKNFTPYVARKVFTLKEIDRIYSSKCPNTEFFKYWTLKESFTKAIGKGIAFGMKNIELNIINDSNIICNQEKCKFILLQEDKYQIGICYREV